jgi:hypothetical protein
MYMVIGTLVTGYYVITPGNPERLSPVFHTRAEARAWLRRNASPEKEERCLS